MYPFLHYICSYIVSEVVHKSAMEMYAWAEFLRDCEASKDKTADLEHTAEFLSSLASVMMPNQGIGNLK